MRRVSARRPGARGGRRRVCRRAGKRVSSTRLRAAGGGEEPGPRSRREGLRAGVGVRGVASRGRGDSLGGLGGAPRTTVGVGPGKPWGGLQLGGARPAPSCPRWRGPVGELCPRLPGVGEGYSQSTPPPPAFRGVPSRRPRRGLGWSDRCVVLLSAAILLWEPHKLCRWPSVGLPGRNPQRGAVPNPSGVGGGRTGV